MLLHDHAIICISTTILEQKIMRRREKRKKVEETEICVLY